MTVEETLALGQLDSTSPGIADTEAIGGAAK